MGIALSISLMRFLISVIATKSSPVHTAEEIKAIDDFNDKIEDTGQRLFACGMDSPDGAFVFDYRTGKSEVIDGPLHPTTEYVSGFWIVKVDDLETAKQLASEGSAACNRKTELRQLHG